MIRTYEVLEALNSGGWSATGDTYEEISFRDDKKKPTKKQFEDKKKELEAQYIANKYQRDRALAYPSIQDVVVALAEKEEGNDAMWKEITAQRAKVKADNPKP